MYAVAQAHDWLSHSAQYKRIRDQVLIDLVSKMKEIDRSNKLFYDPVTDEDAPEYSKVITEPMCLKTIEAKIENQQYLVLDALKMDVSFS